MNTLLRNRRRESGEVINIWILILILVAGVALLIYLLLHLIRIPPRQLPEEAAPQYYQYIYDVIPDFAVAERPVSERERPWAPAGMQAKKPSVLTSTNLIDWEFIQLEPYADGALVAPDGAELTLDAIWDDFLEQNSYQLLLLKPGTTPYRFYKLPQGN